MISRLQLENWKTHKQSVLEFGKGTNVLVGVMGSGKTAVTDAICFCLFGTFPALLSKRVSLDEVIMAKPEKAEKARLQLEFNYAGKNYSVERTIFKGKKTNEAKLYCEKRLIAGSKVNDVNERIEEIIDASYDLFSRAVYSEQNQIDFFLRLSPSERKTKFDELLEINKYERVRANSVSLLNNIKRLAVEKKSFALQQKQKLQTSNITELEKKLEAKKAEQKTIEKSLAEEETEQKKIEKTAEKLEALEEQYKFYKELVTKSNGKIEATENALEKKKKELDGWKGKSLEEEIATAEKKEKELQAGLEQKEKETKKAREQKDLLSQKTGAIESALLQAKKGMLELEKAKAHCPVCKAKLEEKTKKEIIADYEKEKASHLKEKEKNEKEIALLAEELRKLEKESRSVCNEIDSLKEKKAVLKGLQKFSCGIAQQEKEIFLLKEETKKAEKAVAELGFDEKALRKLQDQKTNAVARQRELRVQLESAKEIEKQLAERIGEFKAIEKQLLDLEQKAIALESTGEKLSLFTNCLKETQAELRETLIDATNQAMQDIWERIYPYKDYSSARIFVDEKGDYELVVLDKSGNWTKVEGILSGGERSAAAICIRIAFSLVLAQNLSMLILDEPTHNLDSQAITVLSEMMKSHLPNLVEQIFVITHDKQMEKAASASLYLLERDKDNDGITIPVLKETE